MFSSLIAQSMLGGGPIMASATLLEGASYLF